jgi:hypothetical protein
MLERHRDVQEIPSDGRAPPNVAPHLSIERTAHLGTCRVVLDLTDRLAIGLGQHGAVARDDGHPAPEDPRVALGARLETGVSRGAVEQRRERVVEEPRLRHQRALKAGDGLGLERAADVEPHDQDAQSGHDPEQDGQSRGETEAPSRRGVRHHASPSKR